MNNYFSFHNHTHYSNIRLLDSINKPKNLINYAIELGLSGIAITDHECLSSHIEVNKYAKEIKEKYPNFKIAYGNEIYLVDERIKKQKYYHAILLAKDNIGHRALRELSSIAWYNMYNYGKMDRVPVLKTELKEIVSKYKGHLIMTTACRGSELGTQAWNLINGDESAHDKIVDYMLFCKELFGDDFYIECAPSDNKEQIAINKLYYRISKTFDVKMVYATDSHYLKKEDALIHEAYLKSKDTKDGNREVLSFYESAYMMSQEKVNELLSLSFEKDFIDIMTNNTLEIMNKIEDIDLFHKQKIPMIELENRVLPFKIDFNKEKYPVLKELLNSTDVQEKYWLNECLITLFEKNLLNELYLERLETEADIIKFIGNQLNQQMFAYFNTMKYCIDLFWECGTIVGPGRGSATGFLSNWLLGITQLDPIRWGLQYWRFANKERAELFDIDVDLSPLVRPLVLKKLKQERGENNCLLVATFGTEGTRSAILTACRGYRSKECPNGIDSDIGQYISSMIPSERGFLWPLCDVVNGNKEKDRKPIHNFIIEVNKYPGLLDIMLGIEGIVNKRSSHASGVVLYDDLYDTCALMRTPKGEAITCYSLHDAEYAGDTKYDFLLTEACAKITECLKLVQKYDYTDKSMTLRELYNTILHPDVLNTKDKRIWDSLSKGTTLQVFQFATGVGLDTAMAVKPQNPLEMTAANALMRLMASDKDSERPLDRFIKMKSNILLWYQEMKNKWNLSESQIKTLEKYYLEYNGCVVTQEQMMLVLMDKDISNFSLSEANSARQIVGKKKMEKIPWLKELMYSKMEDKKFADYVWETAIKPSLGYAFSINHSLPYSFVGIQEISLSTLFPSVLWNTSCLCVNAGTLDDAEDESIEEDDDVEDLEIDIEVKEEEKDKKAKNVNYGKMGRAIAEIIKANIKIAPPIINNAEKDFRPDIENNQILYSLKALSKVGDKELNEIFEKRPFSNFSDFLNRTNIKKPAIISLIKSGAFDALENRDRYEIMSEYIEIISEPKTKLNLQNFKGLIDKDMIPESLDFYKRLYNFNKYIRQKEFKKDTTLLLDDRAQFFMKTNFESVYDTGTLSENNLIEINEKTWKKVYDKSMDTARNWLKQNQNEVLREYNSKLYDEVWKKYCIGTISKWEMDSMCFYWHPHELSIVDRNLYGISNFSELPEEPEIDTIFKTKEGREIPLYKITKIIGTCIDKNTSKGSFTLLTPDQEVVEVKLNNEHYAMYNKRISEVQADGKTKKVKESSWFTRGNKIMVVGFRRGNNFVPKKYKNTPEKHRIFLIKDVKDNGEMMFTSARYGDVEVD